MELKQVLLYIVLGFVAELIDGTAGMAYGVCSNTFLRSAGIPSTISSACVHCAEIFTTLASGISHFKIRNVHKKLFFMLIVPGTIGGIMGAYLLVNFESRVLDIIIDSYLIIMGIVIFVKAFRSNDIKREFGGYVVPLGFAGGFTDAMGGGGWGPIVTTTLLASGHEPKKTIGSVNTAEFFITIAETTTFVAMLGDFKSYVSVISGIIIGGVVAAPIGAVLCKKLPVKAILVFVGCLVFLLNIVKLLQHVKI